MPAEQGKTKPNQIRNTAIGNIPLDKNVATYFKEALFDESRFDGITSGSGPKIDGTIDDFPIDDLGWSVDWTLDVTYEVQNTDGTACYTGDKVLKHTAKFANAFGTLNQVMKLNIEKLFGDPAFIRCIDQATIGQQAANHGIPVAQTGQRG